jgi:hypothetical protein
MVMVFLKRFKPLAAETFLHVIKTFMHHGHLICKQAIPTYFGGVVLNNSVSHMPCFGDLQQQNAQE